MGLKSAIKSILGIQDSYKSVVGGMTLGQICDYLDLEITDSAKRLKNEPLTCIAGSLNTVVNGSIYFCRAIKKEKCTEEVRAAFAKGAKCVVCRFPVKDEKGKPLPCVTTKATSTSLVKACELFGHKDRVKAVAITGSVGKTSTKEMLALVSNAKFKTEYSLNNQNGLGRVVQRLQRLEQDTQVFIQEIGISKINSVKWATKALKPDFFVMTNIGLNHVGYFDGRQEGILEEKLNVDVQAAENAHGFVNWDDDLLRNAEYQHPVTSYAIARTDADYYAQNIVERNAKLEFDIVEKATGRAVRAVVSVPGKHNVSNAVCAYAFGRAMGIEEELIVEALSKFETQGVRQNLVEIAGCKLYLDCYNASEGAMQSVVSTMGGIDVPEGGKRVLVFGDIDDKLGELTEEVHRRVGRHVAQSGNADVFICFGAHAAWAAEDAKATSDMEIYSVADRAELNQLVKDFAKPENLLAFKAGQQMRMTRTLDEVFGTAFALLDSDMVIVEGECVTEGDLRVRLFNDYGLGVVRVDKSKPISKVRIPSVVQGYKARLIEDEALAGQPIRKVELPATIRTIEDAAFEGCDKLTEVVFSRDLDYIGFNAFAGCSALECIELPEGVRTVRRGAFARCANLKEVKLPASLATMDPGVFDESPLVTLVCAEGSYAEAFAKEHYADRVVVR